METALAEVEPAPAGFWIRLVAVLVDWLVFYATEFSLRIVAGLIWGGQIAELPVFNGTLGACMLAFGSVSYVTLHALFGQPVGKRVVPVQVARTAGGGRAAGGGRGGDTPARSRGEGARGAARRRGRALRRGPLLRGPRAARAALAGGGGGRARGAPGPDPARSWLAASRQRQPRGRTGAAGRRRGEALGPPPRDARPDDPGGGSGIHARLGRRRLRLDAGPALPAPQMKLEWRP